VDQYHKQKEQKDECIIAEDGAVENPIQFENVNNCSDVLGSESPAAKNPNDERPDLEDSEEGNGTMGEIDEKHKEKEEDQSEEIDDLKSELVDSDEGNETVRVDQYHKEDDGAVENPFEFENVNNCSDAHGSESPTAKNPNDEHSALDDTEEEKDTMGEMGEKEEDKSEENDQSTYESKASEKGGGEIEMEKEQKHDSSNEEDGAAANSFKFDEVGNGSIVLDLESTIAKKSPDKGDNCSKTGTKRNASSITALARVSMSPLKKRRSMAGEAALGIDDGVVGVPSGPVDALVSSIQRTTDLRVNPSSVDWIAQMAATAEQNVTRLANQYECRLRQTRTTLEEELEHVRKELHDEKEQNASKDAEICSSRGEVKRLMVELTSEKEKNKENLAITDMQGKRIQRLEEELDHQKKAHATKLSDMKSIITKQQKSFNATGRRQRHYTDHLKMMVEVVDEELAEAARKYHKQKQRLKELQREMEGLVEKHKEEMERTKREHCQLLTKMEEAHSEEVNALEDELKLLRSML